MHLRILLAIVTFCAAATCAAADKIAVERAADLPRFTYKIDGRLDQLVADDARFTVFARALRHDIESVLQSYDIKDKATRRELLGTLAQLDFLDGHYDAALARAAQIRDLQEKPADKLLSGMTLRAIVDAQAKAGNRTSDAYRRQVSADVSAALEKLPFDVVQNDVREMKMRAEIISEALVLGRIREVLQPTVDKAGALSSDLASQIVSARYALATSLPLKQAMTDTYAAYLAAHKVDKPDIWAQRDVALNAGAPGTPVTIAIWDSGVDTALFPGRVVMDEGKPALVAFDKYSEPSNAALAPFPPEMRRRISALKSRVKGFSDLQSNIDSPEATAVKKELSTLAPAAVRSTIEEISMTANYLHGTHVAGIAVAGNPFARLLVARIEFGYKMLPDPCPSQELTDKDARNAQTTVDYMKAHGVKVVNMSWGGNVTQEEKELELCAIGKDADERKAIARKYFDASKDALTRAMASAPGILFVAAAGNENADSSFNESIPAAIVLPNLLVVGAVDQAGDEASFTSYGPTVKVHADGYQVESVIPGGDRLKESGTSMASPQVANLAGKLLAIDPQLSPRELVDVIVGTADKTPDGRRTLVNPRRALEAVARRRAA
ncbi:MAG: S8 family serine peptidase [Casimicrobiaceae bacterium]